MNRSQRRKKLDPNRLTHEYDDDCCCVWCGFDAAEEYHLRVTSKPSHAREPAPDFAIYCDSRPRTNVA